MLPRLHPRDRVTNQWTAGRAGSSGSTGTVVGVRDDAYERAERQKDASRPFYYHIEYDDGTFDTYVCEAALTKQ